MNKLTVINENGKLVTDSREVAEMTGKEHKNLLRDIKGYVDILDSSILSSQDFFIEDTYTNSQNKEQPCYLLTRKGCDMVANKMTGEKGILFTAEYVTEFEEMERSIKSPVKQLSPMEMLELQFAAFKEHEKELEQQKQKIRIVEEKVQDIKDNLPLLSIDCEQLLNAVRKIGIRALGGKGSAAYKDRSIRSELYFDIHSQLKREFGIRSYKEIKRSQLETAIKIVEKYEKPFILRDQILLLNNQMIM